MMTGGSEYIVDPKINDQPNMISYKVLIIIVFFAAKSAVTDSYGILSRTDCSPNRVYKKDDITCICTSDGRWPHHQCSLVFDTIHKTSCDPDSLVKVDCNVCKCSKTGYIDEKFCTQHICDRNHNLRRKGFSGKTKCEPYHWYYLSSCRICYCINKNNLLCSGGVSNTRKLSLGNDDLIDCGLNFLNDINTLFSADNPLRPNKKEERDKSTVLEIETVPKGSVKKDLSVFFNANEKQSELSVEDNDTFDQDHLNISNEDKLFDGVQDTTKSKPVAKIPEYTAMPSGNYEEDFDNDSDDTESDKNDFDIALEAGNNDTDQGYFGANVQKEYNIIRSQKASDDSKENKSFLKVNIPGLFEKTFTFRRSRVSLDNADCVPGSTVVVLCNTCFCLKNGKMLCTKKRCT